MKILKYLFNTIIIVIAGLAGLFAAGHFGLIDFYRPFIVMSGSMEPAIKVGSVVLVRSAPLYTLGDIITYKQNKKFVTHRIASVGLTDFATKGDANKQNDSTPVTTDQIQGKVVASIPYLGFTASRAQTPIGFIALVIIPATIVVYEELKNLKKELVSSVRKLMHSTLSSQYLGKRFPMQARFAKHRLVHGFATSSGMTPPHVIPVKAVTKSLIRNLLHLKLTFNYINFSHRSFPTTHDLLIFPNSPLFNLNPATSKPAGLVNKAFILPMIGTALTVTIVSSAYFLDTENSQGNVLAAADNFGEQVAQIWVSPNHDCATGAVTTDTQKGILISKQADDQIDLTVQISGADPSTSYNLWINQHPGACPLGSPTVTNFFTTDGSGSAVGTYQTTAFAGADVLWISLSGGSEVLRSSTVTLN